MPVLKIAMNVADQVRSALARLQRAGHRFEEVATSTCAANIEERFGRRLPPAFRCLNTSFSSPEFEVGGVTVFANLNDGSAMDIGVAPFLDRFMSPWLITYHFMQMGRLDSGTNRSGSRMP